MPTFVLLFPVPVSYLPLEPTKKCAYGASKPCHPFVGTLLHVEIPKNLAAISSRSVVLQSRHKCVGSLLYACTVLISCPRIALTKEASFWDQVSMFCTMVADQVLVRARALHRKKRLRSDRKERLDLLKMVWLSARGRAAPAYTWK
jgi:hypothetical protein